MTIRPKNESRTARPLRRNPRGIGYLVLTVPLLWGPIWAAVGAAMFGPQTVASWSGFVLVALLVVCSYTDTRFRRIPNWATYTSVLWALGLNAAAWLTAGLPGGAAWADYLGAIGLTNSLIGAAACFGVMLFLHVACGSGAGDVKLACAIGALLGVERGLEVLIWCHVLAAAVAAVWMIWRIGPLTLATILLRRVGSGLFPQWVAPPTGDKVRALRQPIPLAGFFAAGVVFTLTGVWQ